jgi:hypothetical protein
MAETTRSFRLYRGLVLLVFLLSACSSRSSFVVQSFELNQTSWDSLHIATEFLYQPLFNAKTSVSPDVLVYTVFSADFDTLYVGDGTNISLPDRRLSDRERILVEVCAVFQTMSTCEQKVISASPKKVVAEYAVDFPQDSPLNDKGEVELASVLQRQVFDSDQWENIRKPSGKELSVKIYVEKAPDDYIRFPITRSTTPFALNRYDGHRDLRYQIQSSMMDSDSAVVMFDLYALMSEEPSLVAQERIVVRSKSVEQRTSEVRELVDQAGAVILSEVSGRLGSRRAYIFLIDWSFEPLNKAYLAEFELHWQDAFRGEWSDLTGMLHVRSDGAEGSFQFLRGSETAEKRWNDRISTEYLQLDPLFPERERDRERDTPASGTENTTKRSSRRSQ